MEDSEASQSDNEDASPQPQPQPQPSSLSLKTKKTKEALRSRRGKRSVSPERLIDEAGQPVNLADFSDSEDEQGTLLRIGDVPLHWYDEYEHIGYDIHGRRVARSDKGDQMDEFLSRTDDPNKWRTVYDAMNDKKVVLTDEELRIIRNIRLGRAAHGEFDPTHPRYIVDAGPVRVEALPAPTAPKRRFVPSKWEAKKIVKLVNAIRNGWVRDPAKERATREERVYMLWGATGDEADRKRPKGLPPSIPPPKPRRPGHAESYNPPEEYLPTDEELRAWEELGPSDRPFRFIPTKHNSLREVGAYKNFIQERFERCLDLYLCPRTRRKRLNIDPESLIPKLPKPAELRPFPTTLAVEYVGHQEKVRSISVSPDGQWMVSGSDDHTVRVWETDTGRCFRTWKMEGIVDAVAWNPNPSCPVIAIACEETITIVHALTGGDEAFETAQENIISEQRGIGSSALAKLGMWTVTAEPSDYDPLGRVCSRVVVRTRKRMKDVVWHAKGDYFATVAATQATAKSVLIHRLSHNLTQAPFTKSKGLVQRIAFHPSRPQFFVATHRHIRLYDLVKQQLLKKMQCPAKWISSISVHPGGDNIIVGSYDRKVCWYDLDLSSRPYRTLRYHRKAVRSVHFHPTYPLFVSCSDDGNLHIFHGRVYDDLLTNPLIVPVKIIKAHEITDNLGILDCVFHPSQPFVFSSGADATIRLFT